MYREHVLLSLSLLIGMLFIIDLYIAAMYLNKTNEKNRFQHIQNNEFQEPVTTPMSVPRGRDTEFGFDLKFSPQNAGLFKYFYYPYQGHLTVFLPADKLKALSVNEEDILDYVVKKILEENSFQRNRRRYYSHISEDYARDEVQQGVVWVNDEILMRIASNPSQLNNSYRRKRSSPTSLKVLRTTQEKMNKLLQSSSTSMLYVGSGLSEIPTDW